MTQPAPEYVAARRVLLDVLAALEEHLDSLVLVGAQAVYQHTGDTDLRVPPMTTDADLAVNATVLADTPEIAGALRGAGFSPGSNPGHWIARSDVAVDLMVVPHQAGTARASARAARLPPHAKSTARIARGLEPALVDNTPVTITALDANDARTFNLAVAGPAALLAAKIIKISERFNQASRQPERVKEKDALDAFRLLQAIDTPELVEAAGWADRQRCWRTGDRGHLRSQRLDTRARPAHRGGRGWGRDARRRRLRNPARTQSQPHRTCDRAPVRNLKRSVVGDLGLTRPSDVSSFRALCASSSMRTVINMAPM
ncbi:MAG: hypothetical protein QM619_07140 [Micropruina sp.]|uniref:hypothetical protein n=1 Tax=Micropruina sp. TaxID=2737536 RepID=UPI0039E63A80